MTNEVEGRRGGYGKEHGKGKTRYLLGTATHLFHLLCHPLDVADRKKVRYADRIGVGKDIRKRPDGPCGFSPPGTPSSEFRLTELSVILYIYLFQAGRGEGNVREPVGKIPGRPEKTARPRAHLRGERRGEIGRAHV